MKCAPRPYGGPRLLLSALSVVFVAVFLDSSLSFLRPAMAQPPESKSKSSSKASIVEESPSSGSEGSDAVTSTTAQVSRTARSIGTRAVSTITGEGTAGTIAKFTGPNEIGNSVMIESAGNIGIGTASPSSKLTVNSGGAIAIQGNNSSTAANAYGVQGRITSTAPGAGSSGLRGINDSTTSVGSGVYGTHAGTGSGVYGTSTAGRGVYGLSTSGLGVVGNSGSGTGVTGQHTDTTGTKPGVYGKTNSIEADALGIHGQITATSPGIGSAGVKGENSGTNNNGYGVFGSHAGGGTGVYGSSASGIGIRGTHSDTSGYNPGVQGETNSNDFGAAGVLGSVNSYTPGVSSAGVIGSNNGTNANGYGVLGHHKGSGTGVYGGSFSGIGVHGFSTAYAGTAPGVLGETNSTDQAASGVRGINSNLTSSNGYGVYGSHASGGIGVYGTSSSTGVHGFSSNIGVSGTGNDAFGVRGQSTAGSGVGGFSTAGYGIYGSGPTGIYGISDTGKGIHGVHGPLSGGASGTAPGVLGETHSTSQYAVGVQGVVNSTSPGLSSAAVRGINNGTGPAGIGVWGSQGGSGWGVYAFAPSGRGVYGESASGVGVYGSSSTGSAGYFSGNVNVTGTLTKGAGTFKIDHPLDPANKYLSHSFVESPDMMNIYNGNVTLDKKGQATVKMPDYFTALNHEFRYQLTCIGGAALVYVAQEIKSNQFKIAGGKPGMKVSWQVTGVRKDAYANAHRVVAVEEKKGKERGAYLHPELFGQPKTKAIGYAQSPNAVKAKATKLAQQAAKN